MAQQTTRSGCAGDLLALFLVVGLSWYLPHRLGGGWLAILACFGAAVATEWVHLLVHELGHLLTALAVRLPVTEFSVAASPSTRMRTWAGVRVQIGLAGRRSRVRVGAVSGRRLLAARMVAVSLAGPAADLIVAALAAAAARGISVTTGKAVILMVAAMALFRALANLLPIPSPAGQAFDGWYALLWLVWPRRSSRRLQGVQVLQAAEQARAAGEPVDRAALTALREGPDRPVAAGAALLLLHTADPAQLAELLYDRRQLRWLAMAPGVPHRTRAEIFTLLVNGLVDQIDDRPPDRYAIADAIGMAQAAPGRIAPTTLAYLRLRQGRPLSARHLLDKADFSGTEPAVRASALAVRTMVECELSDVGAAHRLAEEAAALDPAARWVAEARRAVARRATTG